MASTPVTLVIRADATSAIGAGHVMRCLALAHAWRAPGHEVLFCGRIDSDVLKQRITAAGFDFFEPGTAVRDTVEMLRERSLAGSWVALDGYHFGPEWQRDLVAAGFRVLAVDDGALLSGYMAQVIVAPENDALASAYSAPPSTLILAGPQFRLLRPGFTRTARVARTDGAVVLVTFGGADSGNVTRSVVSALDRVLRTSDQALVVLGPLNRHEESVRQALQQVCYRYELHRDVEDMAALYARADLALSAAGGAAWEMAVSGLPAILVAVAANQMAGLEYLSRAGAAIGLGGPEAIPGEGFATLMQALLESPQRRAEMAARGPAACDGRGAIRVCQILRFLSNASSKGDFVLRRAGPSDMESVFRLANDPTVRGNSFAAQPIPLEEHAAWFEGRLASPGTAFFVLELAGVLAALARFDRVDGSAQIDIAVHPAFRGRGLGARILRESAPLAAVCLDVQQLRAVVLEQNAESRRCFLRAGFQETGFENVKGRNCALFSWKPAMAGACLG